MTNNPYNIFIGVDILKESGKLINNILPQNKHKKAIIITDNNIEKHNYSQTLITSLQSFQYKTEKIVIPAGEKSKSFKIYQALVENILEIGITKNDFLIALGGGVVGDLTGFLASTLLRGIPFIQIPTTLLAQVDSSVGGKTAINSINGKNLIGTFYQPKAVIIDPKTLETLPLRQIKSGYAEVLKYALIFDKEFFNFLDENLKQIFKKNLAIYEYIIEKCCNYKKNIVLQDEFETKEIRTLLNLGHTFAHIYENFTNYNSKTLLHGEAVSIGLEKAFLLSKNLKICSKEEFDKLMQHLQKAKIYNINKLKNLKNYQNFTEEFVINVLKKDKKTEQNAFNFVLNTEIGNSIFVKNISKNDILNVIMR